MKDPSQKLVCPSRRGGARADSPTAHEAEGVGRCLRHPALLLFCTVIATVVICYLLITIANKVGIVK